MYPVVQYNVFHHNLCHSWADINRDKNNATELPHIDFEIAAKFIITIDHIYTMYMSMQRCIGPTNNYIKIITDWRKTYLILYNSIWQEPHNSACTKINWLLLLYLYIQ